MTLEDLLKIKDETLPQLSLRINQCPIKIYVSAGDEGIKKGSRIVLQGALETVYNLMKQDGVDQLNTVETSKASNEKVLKLWDDNGNLTGADTFVEECIGNVVEPGARQVYDYKYL